jgi:hypothetical protein
MAVFPIVGRFDGDFVPHLVAVNTDDTMDQVAEKVAIHSVGRRVPVAKGKADYEVFLHGKLMPGKSTLAKIMEGTAVPALQWFDVRWKK